MCKFPHIHVLTYTLTHSFQLLPPSTHAVRDGDVLVLCCRDQDPVLLPASNSSGQRKSRKDKKRGLTRIQQDAGEELVWVDTQEAGHDHVVATITRTRSAL